MAPDITSQVKKSQPANDLSLDFADDEAWARFWGFFAKTTAPTLAGDTLISDNRGFAEE
jgi:hypothetical protein